MPRKSNKRVRAEDDNDNLPTAKRMNQMDTDDGNGLPTANLSDESSSPQQNLASDEPANQNLQYYQMNKVLFEAHLEWIERHQASM